MKRLFGVTVTLLASLGANADTSKDAAARLPSDPCQQASALAGAYQLTRAGLGGSTSKELGQMVEKGDFADLKQYVSLAEQSKLSPTVASAALLFFCQKRPAAESVKTSLAPLAECNSEAWANKRADVNPADIKTSIACVQGFFGAPAKQ